MARKLREVAPESDKAVTLLHVRFVFVLSRCTALESALTDWHTQGGTAFPIHDTDCENTFRCLGVLVAAQSGCAAKVCSTVQAGELLSVRLWRLGRGGLPGPGELAQAACSRGLIHSEEDEGSTSGGTLVLSIDWQHLSASHTALRSGGPQMQPSKGHPLHAQAAASTCSDSFTRSTWADCLTRRSICRSMQCGWGPWRSRNTSSSSTQWTLCTTRCVWLKTLVCHSSSKVCAPAAASWASVALLERSLCSPRLLSVEHEWC